MTFTITRHWLTCLEKKKEHRRKMRRELDAAIEAGDTRKVDWLSWWLDFTWFSESGEPRP